MAKENEKDARAPDVEETNVKETLAANITRYRQKLGLSRAALAEKLGVSEMAIGQYERGARLPSIEILCRISKILNVSIDSLVETEAKWRDKFFILNMLGFDAEINENGGVTIFKRQYSRTVEIQAPIKRMKISRAKEGEPIKLIEKSTYYKGMKFKYPDANKDFVAEFKGNECGLQFETFISSLSVFFERIVGMEYFVTQMAIEAATKNEITMPDLALIDKRTLQPVV